MRSIYSTFLYGDMSVAEARKAQAPDGSEKSEYLDGAAVVYRYGSVGNIGVMAFSGRRKKPDGYYRFDRVEARENWINRWKNGIQERKAWQDERRAERAKGHTLTVGRILYTSWGYDQTNIDFYEVTEVVGKCTVKIRQVASALAEGGERGPSEPVVPVPGAFLEREEEMTKRASSDNSVRIASYASASEWDGKPKNQTGAYWGH